jgi:hypothetical protein
LGLSLRAPVYHEDTATFSFTWVSGEAELDAAAEACIDTLFEPTNATWIAAYGPTPTPQETSTPADPSETDAARATPETAGCRVRGHPPNFTRPSQQLGETAGGCCGHSLPPPC